LFMFLFLFPQSVSVSFCFCFPNLFLLLVSVYVFPINGFGWENSSTARIATEIIIFYGSVFPICF
jgi:hypothetical protein